jgi:hypothetical protein
MAVAQGAGAASSPIWVEPSLEELLKSLNLKEEDIGGFFVAKEQIDELKEETKWMAVMRLLTTKSFSRSSLNKTMSFASAPVKKVVFRELEENRFGTRQLVMFEHAPCASLWSKQQFRLLYGIKFSPTITQE